MCAKVDKVVKLYKTLSQTPILTGGKILLNGYVNTLWSQRSVEKGKFVKFNRTHVINKNLEKVTEILPHDTTNELLSTVAPSERFRAVIKEVLNGKEDRKQYLEIWSNNNLTNTVDLTALDIHGYVYTDVEFGAFEWSPDETKVIYVAEKKLPKREPFYKRKCDKPQNSSDGDSAIPPTKGEEYIYRQDWGEQLVGKCQSVVAVYDIHEDNVKILEGVPEHLCPGQVTWSADGTYIAGIVWDDRPRKLGLVYCTNRPSKVFKLSLSGAYKELSEDGKSVQCPIFTPDGRYLLWLECPSGGTHRAAMALVRIDLPITIEPIIPITIVNIIDVYSQTANGQLFYGIFNTKYPQRCWASDNRRLIFSTYQKCAIKSYVVDIESCDITELKFEEGSQVIQDVCNDVVLASRKNYFQPDNVVLAKLPAKGKEKDIEWKNLIDSQTISGLENNMYQYLELRHENSDAVNNFTAIYVGPKQGSDKSVPLIVWPHGGPHSSYFNAFSLECALFGTLGFAVVFVNYRGSLGAGQKNVDFLRGRVGDTDVKDCILAAQQCSTQFPWINSNKMVLVGGSHGGFLVHHLSGQYPDMFKAVLSRNPVIDIASMSIISDIPDWCAVEAGSEFTQKGPVNDELFLAMRKASPIQYAHQIKAPTFLMIGSKDLRVPAAQGMELYHRLKANGVPVRMNLYDDNHPLATVPNEMDNLINGALWLLEYTA